MFPFRDTIVLLFICGTLPVCFVRPFYGICLWTIVSFLNPQTLTWGPALGFPLAVAVAIPTLAGFFVFVRGWMPRLASVEFCLIFALWLWFTITSEAASNTPLFMHHAQDTWYRWQFVSKILLMTTITLATLRSFAQLRRLVLVLAGCFGVFVAKAFPFIILTGGAFRLYGPDYSMIADNNDFGLALNMTAPLFFFLALTEQNRWVKRMFAALFVMTIPAIFCTYSRGALVGLIVIFTCMFFQLKQRFALLPVIVLAVLVAVLFAPPAWKHRMDPTTDDVMDASARGRLNAWAYSWNLASDYPITGGGFATFTPQLFARYAPKALDIHGPHSVYFQVLAEHGFLGLGLYLSLILAAAAGSFQVMRMARFYGDQVIIHYVNMFRFSMLGFLTSGVFLGRAYFDYFFTIVACIAILKRVGRERWAEHENGAAAEDETEPAIEEGASQYGAIALRGA
jgi:probable O-glycosylation ligase (exosortase A-associated)